MFQTELDRLEAKARREGRAQARREMQTEFERLEQLQTEFERLKAKTRRAGRAQDRQELQTEFARLEAEARRESEELGKQTARLEGERQALHRALRRIVQARFPTASETVYTRIGELQDLALLDELIRSAAVASNIEEIERLLADANGQ